MMASTETAIKQSRGKIDVRLGDIQISSCFDSGKLVLQTSMLLCIVRVATWHFIAGNLDNVEQCQAPFEYKLWTAPDCAGTCYENGNRTWFHFSVRIPRNYTNKIMRCVGL